MRKRRITRHERAQHRKRKISASLTRGVFTAEIFPRVKQKMKKKWARLFFLLKKKNCRFYLMKRKNQKILTTNLWFFRVEFFNFFI